MHRRLSRRVFYCLLGQRLIQMTAGGYTEFKFQNDCNSKAQLQVQKTQAIYEL